MDAKIFANHAIDHTCQAIVEFTVADKIKANAWFVCVFLRSDAFSDLHLV